MMITRAIRNLFGAALITAVALAASGQSRAANLTALVILTGTDDASPAAGPITQASTGDGSPPGVVILRGSPPPAARPPDATSAETSNCAPQLAP